MASQAASLVPSRSPSRSVSPVPGYRMMQNRSSRPHSAAPGTKTHHKTEPASPVINLRNLISMEPPEGPRTPKLAANFGCDLGEALQNIHEKRSELATGGIEALRDMYRDGRVEAPNAFKGGVNRHEKRTIQVDTNPGNQQYPSLYVQSLSAPLQPQNHSKVNEPRLPPKHKEHLNRKAKELSLYSRQNISSRPKSAPSGARGRPIPISVPTVEININGSSSPTTPKLSQW